MAVTRCHVCGRMTGCCGGCGTYRVVSGQWDVLAGPVPLACGGMGVELALEERSDHSAQRVCQTGLLGGMAVDVMRRINPMRLLTSLLRA